MRIGNPLPTATQTIQIGGLTSTLLSKTIPITPVSSGAAATIGPFTGQTSVSVCNLDTAQPVFLCDATNSTTGLGIRIGPLATLSIDTQSAVKITSALASTTNVTGIAQTQV